MAAASTPKKPDVLNSNFLGNYTPVKMWGWCSSGMFRIRDIDGRVMTAYEVEYDDYEAANANIAIWLLEQARKDLAHNTAESPRNDTRQLPNGNPYLVVQAIDAAIATYKANMRVDPVAKEME